MCLGLFACVSEDAAGKRDGDRARGEPRTTRNARRRRTRAAQRAATSPAEDTATPTSSPPIVPSPHALTEAMRKAYRAGILAQWPETDFDLAFLRDQVHVLDYMLRSGTSNLRIFYQQLALDAAFELHAMIRAYRQAGGTLEDCLFADTVSLPESLLPITIF